jgi:transglutaminase-like putative cysteine protease
MRIRLAHMTRYAYETQARSIIQILRLTPRSHEGQRVAKWRVEIDADARLHKGEDAIGNLTHTVYVPGPIPELTLTVEGEIETWETHGVVRGSVERFDPAVFLRETPLTEADRELKTFAQDIAASHAGLLDQLHALMTALHREVVFDTEPTHAATTASEAFALKRGVCQDLSHIFIAVARTLGAPARYVSGHLARADGVVEQEAAHAWAEAFVPGLGWIGFDPANGVCPTPAYARVAAGLDYLGAAPVRGSRVGGGSETMGVKLHVAHAARQTQA